jgi:hypothetical protein
VMDVVGDELELVRMISRLATDRRGSVGHAVIGVGPTNNLAFVIEPTAALVVLHQPEGRVDSGRPTGGQHGVVQGTRSEFDELLAQLDRRNVAHVGEGVGVREAADLVGDGIGHLVATQADVCAPDSGDGVEVFVPIAIDQSSSRAMFDRERVDGLVSVEGLKRMQMVAATRLDKSFRSSTVFIYLCSIVLCSIIGYPSRRPASPATGTT